MKLENQVCTIEQASNLKELGVAQISQFYHWHEKTPTNSNLQYYGYAQNQIPWITILGKRSNVSGYEGWTHDELSAYTGTELGVMLPLGYHTHTRDFDHADWLCYDNENEVIDFLHSFKTEAEARAAILIYLLKNGLITVEEINQRLQNS